VKAGHLREQLIFTQARREIDPHVDGSLYKR
jgi:hypothetical protein